MFKQWRRILAEKLIDFSLQVGKIELDPTDQLNLAHFYEDAALFNSFKHLQAMRRQEIQARNIAANSYEELIFNKGRYFENMNLENELKRNYIHYNRRRKKQKPA